MTLLFPRILTVDATGALSRLARACLEWADRPAVVSDVPTLQAAYDEIAGAGAPWALLLAAPLEGETGETVEAFIEAVAERAPDLPMMLFTDLLAPSVLPRLLVLEPDADLAVIARAFTAALRGDAFSPAERAVAAAAEPPDQTPVPPIDGRMARSVLDRLAADISAPAVALWARSGQFVAEVGGAESLLAEMGQALRATLTAAVGMNAVAGGRASAMQVIDGEQYDIFALSVGVHYLLVAVFDGSVGMRQLGAMNRYGRRAAEDLVAFLGANAFAHTTPAPARAPGRPEREALPAPTVRRGRAVPPPEPPAPVPDDEPLAVRAETWEVPAPVPEPEPLRLEPIAELDVSLFSGQQLASVDVSAFDDLFNPDTLAQLASETRSTRGPLTYDEARDLGIL
jgi:hypothetical protein